MTPPCTRDGDADEATEPGRSYVETGQTFDETREVMSSAERNNFLREHGTRIAVDKTALVEADYSTEPGDIPAVIESAHPGPLRTGPRQGSIWRVSVAEIANSSLRRWIARSANHAPPRRRKTRRPGFTD